MIGLTLDQMDRYLAAREIILKIRSENPGLTLGILDVGGYSKTLDQEIVFPIRQILNEQDVVVADVPECSEPGYIRINPNELLPFENGSFDIVVCLDVLEHITPIFRDRFVRDILRVSSRYLILAAPFRNSSREQADAFLQSFTHSSLRGRNSMLEEHLRFGLPDHRQLDAILDELKIDYLTFENGRLDRWYLLMSVKHALLQGQNPRKVMELEASLHQFAQVACGKNEGYRTFYLISRSDRNLSSRFTELLNPVKHSDPVADARFSMACARMLELSADHAQNLAERLHERNLISLKDQSMIQDYQIQNRNLEKRLRQVESRFNQLRQQIASRDQTIQDLRKEIRSFTSESERIRQESEVLRLKLSEYEAHMLQYDRTVREIHSSRAFKIARGATRGIRKIQQSMQGRKSAINGPSDSQISAPPAQPANDDRPVESARKPRGSGPLISVLIPVFNTDPDVLEDTLNSVWHQSYPDWELCAVDDASSDLETVTTLKKFQLRDPEHIRIHFQAGNQGIAQTTNRAAGIASGEFIALLDHDDLLTPDALEEIANAITVNPEADFIYSDEDKMAEDGSLTCPFHKPDFSPELLLSQNYLNHLSVIRRSLFDEVGGFGKGYDGSQDYDLFLKITEKARKILHIPKILYHWRMVPGSAAARVDAKGGPWMESALKSLQSAVARRAWNARVETGIMPGTYRVKFDVGPDMGASIIIPTRDCPEYLERCLSSIYRLTQNRRFEIILVSNSSELSRTYDLLNSYSSQYGNFRFFRHDFAFNFSQINNCGARQAQHPILVFLNNDTEVISPDWLDALMEHAQRKEIGAVGAKLLFSDDTIQHAGVIAGISGIAAHVFLGMPDLTSHYFSHANLIRNYSAVTGACMAVRRDVFNEIGGFNEELQVAFNDIDFCLEIIRRGYRIVYTPYARLYHHESKSRGSDDLDETRPRFDAERAYMLSKWGNRLYCDPFYNPNLTITRTDMTPGHPSEWDSIRHFRDVFGTIFESFTERRT